jgi:hypothetical protein
MITHLNIAKEIHRRYSESKNDQAKEQTDIRNVVNC